MGTALQRFRRRKASLCGKLCSPWVSYVIIAAAAVLSIGNWGLVSGVLYGWQVLPRPERVTELYFTDAQHRGTTDASGMHRVAFTVHNAEHRTTRYNYTIITSIPEHRLQVTQGSLTLGHDSHQDIVRILAMPTPTPRAKVQVTLHYYAISPGKDRATMRTQSIHYWI